MRFSDLKKIKQQASEPASGRRGRPAPDRGPVAEEELAGARRPEPPAAQPRPVRRPEPPIAEKPAPEPLSKQPEAPAAEPGPGAAAPERPASNYESPQKSRRDARAKASVPQAAFKDLDARAREVYSTLLEQSGALIKAVDQPYTEKYEAVVSVCRLVSDTLRTNGVLLNYTTFSTADDYLRAHTANTTILALAMGLEAGLEEPELSLLGFCSMAHDIGMTEYSSLYNSPERLGEKEFAEMSLHAEAGVAKLERIVDLDYRIKERARHIVLQTHERDDGSGYPDRLSDEEIDPLAQLISIADVYEALTHPRAWREAMNPADAVRDLVEKEGRGFNAMAVKALISAISIYPPGSIVALSSGEIARVIKATRGFLTKPLVEILLDQDFSRLRPYKLDLFEHPLVSIERPVPFKELEARNPKFAAGVEMSRWWVEW